MIEKQIRIDKFCANNFLNFLEEVFFMKNTEMQI